MTNLTATIDAYAALKAEIGRLELRKKELEASLADLKAGNYESADYRLGIQDIYGTAPDDQLKTEIKAVLVQAEKDYRATLSSQYLTAHTVKTHVRRHTINLPTGKNLAA